MECRSHVDCIEMIKTRVHTFMTYVHICIIFQWIVILLHIRGTHPERVLGRETEDFDFDGLPGAQFEFKIGIPTGGEQCFYQPAKEGATFHMTFKVLRGSDRSVNVYLKDAALQTVESSNDQTEGNLEMAVPVTGTYTVCIENTSRTAAKLVYVYIVTFVKEEWTSFVNEIEEMGELSNNFTSIVKEVQGSLETIKLHQATCRMHVIKDWYIALETLDYVRNWSILQIIVMMSTSASTVYFVRRLFRMPGNAHLNKPRA